MNKIDFNKAVEFVINSKLDYASLTETDEYKIVNANIGLNKSFTDEMAHIRLETILKGDLYKIIFSGKDNVKLTVLYKIKTGSEECYYATIIVKDESLKRKIRESAKTMKGVELKVRCISGGIDYFELIDIIELDKPCNFGRYICEDCGYDYGFNETSRCCICEGKVRKVYDFY